MIPKVRDTARPRPLVPVLPLHQIVVTPIRAGHDANYHGARRRRSLTAVLMNNGSFARTTLGMSLSYLMRHRRSRFLCRHMVPVGFAGCCAMCQKMPARLDSEFCSDACRSMSTHMGLPGSHQQQQPTAPRQPAPHMQRAPSGGGSGVAVGVPHGNKRSAENSVPEGLGLTCQECRRAITKESRIGSRFCGRNCEEASRKYNNSSSSSKSRR